jgi:hypothetical protein
MMIKTNPAPFRSLRVIMASIQTHEELLKQAWEGSEEHWRIHRALAQLGQQLDEAEGLWKSHHAKA